MEATAVAAEGADRAPSRQANADTTITVNAQTLDDFLDPTHASMAQQESQPASAPQTTTTRPSDDADYPPMNYEGWILCPTCECRCSSKSQLDYHDGTNPDHRPSCKTFHR